jgi:hypothetical protein
MTERRAAILWMYDNALENCGFTRLDALPGPGKPHQPTTDDEVDRVWDEALRLIGPYVTIDEILDALEWRGTS